MSEKGDSSDDDGLEELFDKARISEKGLLKLSTHEVTDQRTFLLLSASEISSLKLAVVDKACLINLIDTLRPQPVLPEKEGASEIVQATPSPVPQKPASTTPSPSVVSPQEQAQVIPGSTASLSFGVADVAAFLAGRQFPPELNAALNALPPSQPSRVDASSPALTRPDVQGLFQHSNPPALPSPVRYDRHQAVLPNVIPSAYSQGYSSQQSFPAYLPPLFGAQSCMPSRLITTQTLSRDQQLQHHYAGYQNSVLKDYSNLNFVSQSAGQGQLFLPVNFISHIRGSGRSEDEELLKTEGGASIYLSNSPRKLVAEKLNHR